MTGIDQNLTRRKFMVVGSAAVVATPLLSNLTGIIPEAEAATFKKAPMFIL